MTLKFLLPFYFCLSACLPAAAALGIKPDGHLDMPVLRKAYMESEFEKVRASLEGFLKKHPKDVTRDEKIFTHMYLGVICAADSTTEIRAESHFNALLQLSPHIEPVDMFVPPKIQDLFDRIKRDYLKRQEYEKRYDAFGNPIASGPDSAYASPNATAPGVGGNPNAPQGETHPARKDAAGDAPRTGAQSAKHPAISANDRHAWVWWTVGSAAVVAASVGVYVLVASDPSPSPHRTTADGTLRAGP